MAPDVETVQDENGFVPVETLEVAGEIVDAEGNRWARPADNVLDLGDIGARNPMAFPIDLVDPRTSYGRRGTRHEGFYFQWIRLDELPWYSSLGYVRVRAREMQRFEDMEKEYGRSTSTEFIEFAGACPVKCPIHIKQAADADKGASRKLALEGTQPSEEVLESARRGQIIERTIRKTEVADEPAPKAPRRGRR